MKTPETFRWNPVGSQSHPVELGQQPEVSLASAGATRTTKRRQRGRRPCYRAPKSSFSQSAHRLNERRGRVPRLEAAWPRGPAGVQEHGERTLGFPSNRRGLPPSLVHYFGPRSTEPETPGLPRRRLDGAGAKPQTRGGIAGRAQESGETGPQESESFIVPWKPGHSPWEDPAEGREGRVTDLLSGHRARTPSLSTLFTRRRRIAERGAKP